MDFSDWIEKRIFIEGGFSNHPSDTGGRTMWGVTEAVARAYGYKGDMRNLPRETAKEIYLKRYILEPQFDKIGALSEKIAYEMFDSGVNLGQYWPVYWLQKSLNVANRRGKDFPDIATDGRIGPMTLYALKVYLEKRKEGESILFKCLNGLQLCRYVDIAERDERQEDFFNGWVAKNVT